jgi:hypothetical protein
MNIHVSTSSLRPHTLVVILVAPLRRAICADAKAAAVSRAEK